MISQSPPATTLPNTRADIPTLPNIRVDTPTLPSIESIPLPFPTSSGYLYPSQRLEATNRRMGPELPFDQSRSTPCFDLQYCSCLGASTLDEARSAHWVHWKCSSCLGASTICQSRSTPCFSLSLWKSHGSDLSSRFRVWHAEWMCIQLT